MDTLLTPQRRAQTPWGRLALCLVVVLLVAPLACTALTGLTGVSEEYAELVHGTVTAHVMLWAIGALRWPDWLP